MKLKNIILISTVIICIGILGFSHYQYNQKLKSIAEEAQHFVQPTYPQTSADIEEEGTSSEKVAVSGLIGKTLKDTEDEETISMTIFGSVSLGNPENSDTGWPYLLSTDIKEQIGEEKLKTTVINVNRASSLDVYNGDYLSAVIDSQPDILIIEPFILNDNGIVRIEDTLFVLEHILTIVSKELEDTEILITPPNPVEGAVFYISQVEAVEEFVQSKGYSFVDHWNAWPDESDLPDYLDNNRPNGDGHQVWADFMYDYLTK
ncbi:SGNH/GDSL hydrolase family protein [Alkalihalobacillus sp. LMS39]|uniref:SGNH/GDSL hydrolase family protein n=1 Tax=Alkalihalobacillus sp. LMS39 TaxID=2924032 RepID=UPI001FB3486D|nr:SGNH/GDSL hydrolase family protein [Alkalihalobacillus sp. LMS39]UOE93835.1 SGNH/GDSL hydrolase family protein [Alkalihalobacillus sp. LMS39]